MAVSTNNDYKDKYNTVSQMIKDIGNNINLVNSNYSEFKKRLRNTDVGTGFAEAKKLYKDILENIDILVTSANILKDVIPKLEKKKTDLMKDSAKLDLEVVKCADKEKENLKDVQKISAELKTKIRILEQKIQNLSELNIKINSIITDIDTGGAELFKKNFVTKWEQYKNQIRLIGDENGLSEAVIKNKKDVAKIEEDYKKLNESYKKLVIPETFKKMEENSEQKHDTYDELNKLDTESNSLLAKSKRYLDAVNTNLDATNNKVENISEFSTKFKDAISDINNELNSLIKDYANYLSGIDISTLDKAKVFFKDLGKWVLHAVEEAAAANLGEQDKPKGTTVDRALRITKFGGKALINKISDKLIGVKIIHDPK